MQMNACSPRWGGELRQDLTGSPPALPTSLDLEQPEGEPLCWPRGEVRWLPTGRRDTGKALAGHGCVQVVISAFAP